MKTAATLVSLLVLGWSETLLGFPELSDPLYTPQEMFDQNQIWGTWYDVAIATSCSFMRRFHQKAPIFKIELLEGSTEGKIQAIQTGQIHGMCRQTSMEYELTSTPGRFYHLASGLDTYVVHTNYNEYAMVIMILPTTRSTADKSISVRLFSRSKTVRATLLEEFKTLAREHGMTDDSVIVKQDKGDCVPGVQLVEPDAPEVRNYWDIFHECVTLTPLPPSLPHTEACKKAPDVGPCFGIHLRYFYNSTSMSCELFKFGGCLGNQNNFETERECLQRCRTEAACRLPLLATPCTHQPPIWAFDSSVGLCVPYKDGFCQTNANKFYSKAECDEYCGTAGAGEMRLHEQTQSDTS
uniref:Protein AMBP n=1 Tax=Mola mola TaxID=94237 RepID=A0A3Q3XGU2_MOLML